MSNEKANIITHMFENGRFGKKNDKGFYIHTTDKKGKPRKERDLKWISAGAMLRTKRKPPVTDQEIIERMMLPMLMESSAAWKMKSSRVPQKSIWH